MNEIDELGNPNGDVVADFVEHNQGLSSGEKAIAEYDTLEKIVEQLSKPGYHDDIGHRIENNVAFIALQRYGKHWDSFVKRLEVAEGIAQQILVRMGDAPLDMILHCPHCGVQHIDAPEPEMCKCGHHRSRHSSVAPSLAPCQVSGDSDATTEAYRGAVMCKCLNFTVAWDNPPHKTHLCKTADGGCGKLFKPALVPTNGVKEISENKN